jgi:tryptophan 2,3-dioxygenase
MRTSLRAQALTEADEDRLRERYDSEQDSARHYLLADDIEDPDRRRQLKRMRASILFIDSNRQLPLLSWPSEIIDSLVELEQALLLFRHRHARMVERVIGRRVGTGGSAGVDYLDRTALEYRVFKEIWAARTLLLQPELAPPVRQPTFYGLRGP